MKVGDYVRTEDGQLFRWDKWFTTDKSKDGFDSAYIFIDINSIIKFSPNIIDLIEVGDYVNGLPVESVCGTRWDENDLRVWLAVATKYKKEYGVENSEGNYEFETLYRCIKPENIKSIVTHEQFSQMEYWIGE
jgi:hypothetical protein